MKLNKNMMLAAGVALVLLLVWMRRPQNTREFFDSGDGKLVFYYADWCGHCKQAKPEFVKAKETLGDHAVMVDCSKRENAERYQVSAFPTFRYFQDASTPLDSTSGFEVYRGKRDSASLLEYFQNEK